MKGRLEVIKLFLSEGNEYDLYSMDIAEKKRVSKEILDSIDWIPTDVTKQDMIDLLDNGSNKYEVSEKITSAIQNKFNIYHAGDLDRFYPVILGGLKTFYWVYSHNRAYTYNLIVLDSNLRIKVTQKSVKHETAFNSRESLFDLIIKNADYFE